MNLLHNIMVLRNWLSIILFGSVLTLSGCGLDLIHNSSSSDSDKKEGLPEGMKQVLNLGTSEQLFSFKSSNATSVLTNSVNAAHNVVGDTDNLAKLFILDIGDGQAKAYLDKVDFDQFHVVKDGNKLAYLVRLSESSHKKLEMKGGGWFILKDGSEPIFLKGPTLFDYIRDPSEYVGQTDSGGIVLSYGAYFDLNGNPLSFGKNITNVSRAQFVSGDFVALARKIQGQDRTTLVNTKTGYRRGYDSYFTPDFVQITDDGKGLMADIQSSNYSFTKTYISRLEDEFDQTYVDAEGRGPVFDRNDLKGCLWFNSSVRIPGQEAALLTCYVSPADLGMPSHKLVRVEPKAGNQWKMKLLVDLSSDTALSHVKAARPFVQGNDYILIRNGTQIIHVPNNNWKGNVKTIKAQMAMVFDVRPSMDLTKFMIIGEQLNGDQVMKIYEGATGDLVDTKNIEVK